MIYIIYYFVKHPILQRISCQIKNPKQTAIFSAKIDERLTKRRSDGRKADTGANNI